MPARKPGRRSASRSVRSAAHASLDALEPRICMTIFSVTTTADSGAGSFRQAILNANATTTADTIEFHIGSGLRTITPATPLPAITQI